MAAKGTSTTAHAADPNANGGAGAVPSKLPMPLTAEQLMELRAAFDTFDTDKSGSVLAREHLLLLFRC